MDRVLLFEHLQRVHSSAELIRREAEMLRAHNGEPKDELGQKMLAAIRQESARRAFGSKELKEKCFPSR